MNQKTLIITIIVLVVINLTTLSFLWLTRSKSHRTIRPFPDKRIEQVLEKRLKLSKEQSEAFKNAREEHFEKTAPLIDLIHKNRQKLNNPASDQLTASEVDVLTASIGTSTTQLETYNFDHMQRLRNICDETQRKKLNHLMNRMIERGHTSRTKRRKKIKLKDKVKSK